MFGKDVDPTDNGAGYGGWANYGRLGPQLHAVGIEFDARGANGDERIHVRNDIENPDFGSTEAEVVRRVTDTWDTYYATFGYPRREHQNRFVFWTGHGEVHLDRVRYHPA